MIEQELLEITKEINGEERPEDEWFVDTITALIAEVRLLNTAAKAILAIDSTIHDHPTWGLDMAKGIARKALEKLEGRS